MYAESPLLTLAEAAGYLNVSERRVRDLWNKRLLPCVKIGTSLRFRRLALDSFIDAGDTALKANY